MTEVDVTSGVPQGSVLGFLFFLLFIDDLPDEVVHSVYFLFCDDLCDIRPEWTKMQIRNFSS